MPSTQSSQQHAQSTVDYRRLRAVAYTTRPYDTFESDIQQDIFNQIDHAIQSFIGSITGGASPIGQAALAAEFVTSAALHPGHTTRHLLNALQASSSMALKLPQYIMGTQHPTPHGRRHRSDQWHTWPFNFWADAHDAVEAWWQNYIEDLEGLSLSDRKRLQFHIQQMIAAVDPENSFMTNPDIQKSTLDAKGANLMAGGRRLIEDVWSAASELVLGFDDPVPPLKYTPGKDVALTSGDVVHQTPLMELIHYHPTTQKVAKEPILITPAWIMKYYIMDLTPETSLVKYLIDQGHSVFMISWRNPTPSDHNLSLLDYLIDGPLAAMEVIQGFYPASKVHGVGYCLGGTLLSILAAYLARENVDALASMTLLAAQTDFTEAGEITTFLNDADVALLDHMMTQAGDLTGGQMASAFQALRPHELIWEAALDKYLTQQTPHINALMSWNQDQTRMPARMHREYLHSLFMNNELAENKFIIGDKSISLLDIRCPIFAVGTEKDHIAPWKSVYKITAHPHTDVTFVLTNGGHNAGIISEPSHPRRHYRIHTAKADAPHMDPEQWLETADLRAGSWWTGWNAWLHEHSSVDTAPAPAAPDASLGPAPGTYVLQR